MIQLTQLIHDVILNCWWSHPRGGQTTYAAGQQGNNTLVQGVANTAEETYGLFFVKIAKGEGHIAKQCTKPHEEKGWNMVYNDKVLLVKLKHSGQALIEEEIAFLVDPGLPDIQTSQTVITHNASYHSNDLDAYDSDYDEINSARLLMAQSLKEMAQMHSLSQTETDITSDSNIIPYSQYLSETQQETVQNSNSSAQQDVLILSMFDQLSTQVTHCTTVNKALNTELDRYKEEVKDLKEKQNVENSFSGSNEQYSMPKISIGFEKPFCLKKARESRPKLYDGNTILKMDTIVVPDSDETLALSEESLKCILEIDLVPALDPSHSSTTVISRVLSKKEPLPTAITEGSGVVLN
ncbi:hypothetical protein Tco_0360069 [Tanacetum coccineum]